MSEKIIHPVPRGIVNPNYPGFQHLAHTLQVGFLSFFFIKNCVNNIFLYDYNMLYFIFQDYSSNIEPFYPSENDMTDDDFDTDIIETKCDGEATQKIDDFKTRNETKKK